MVTLTPETTSIISRHKKKQFWFLQTTVSDSVACRACVPNWNNDRSRNNPFYNLSFIVSLLHFKTFPMTPTLLRVRAVCLPWTKKAWCNLPLVNSPTSSPTIFPWPGPCFGLDQHTGHIPVSSFFSLLFPQLISFLPEMLPFGEIFLLTHIKLQKFPHPNTPLLTCNF